jgi:hypothetical protein
MNGKTLGTADSASHEALVLVTYAENGMVRQASRHIVYINKNDRRLYERIASEKKVEIQ